MRWEFLHDLIAVERGAEWRPCFRWRKVRLIDGTTRSGSLMRRHIRGQWQYRRITDAEEAERFQQEAW